MPQIQLVKPEIPPELRTCAADPPIGAIETQREAIDYLIVLWDAGEDCRAKHRALIDLLR